MTFSESELASIESACKLLCPSWPFTDIEVEQYLAGGYRNRNYRLRYNGKSYVVRIAAPGGETDFAHEQVLLRALADVFPRTNAGLTLSVAPVVASCTSEGLLLSRWMSAPLLASCRGITAETLGTYLANLHSSLAALPNGVVATGDLRSSTVSYTHLTLPTTPYV